MRCIIVVSKDWRLDISSLGRLRVIVLIAPELALLAPLVPTIVKVSVLATIVTVLGGLEGSRVPLGLAIVTIILIIKGLPVLGRRVGRSGALVFGVGRVLILCVVV